MKNFIKTAAACIAVSLATLSANAQYDVTYHNGIKIDNLSYGYGSINTITPSTINIKNNTPYNDPFTKISYNSIELSTGSVSTKLSSSSISLGSTYIDRSSIKTKTINSEKINSKVLWGDWMQFSNPSNSNRFGFHNSQGNTSFNFYSYYNGKYNWHIIDASMDGKVAIGAIAQNSPYKFSVNGSVGVNGKIECEALEVKNLSLADYVFADDYKLKPLDEVEAFIEENSHLPNVPSAKKVAEEGMNVGEFQNILLEKVEELTLYMIQQNKTIASQQKLIEQLQEQLQK